MIDLGLFGLREGGWSHLPGVSGHWCDSESSSLGSGDPLGILSMTGGRSSRGMREVEAATGGSSPTSMTESGWAVRGGVCGWWDTVWQPLCKREIAPP